jgi:hypothetical protein
MSRSHTGIRQLCGVALAWVCAAAQAGVTVSDPPAGHDFGRVPLAATYATQYFSLTNDGTATVTLGQAAIDGELATCAALTCPLPAASDFVLVEGGDGCSGKTLAAGASCSLLVGFVPTAPGGRTARLTLPVAGSDTVERILSGSGRADPFDCVMDWAERTYPELMSSGTTTFVLSPFYARCYGNGLCVGADVLATVAPASVYLHQNGELTRYEYLSTVVEAAGCR